MRIRICFLAIMMITALSLSGIHTAFAETYRVYGVTSGDVLHVRAQPSSEARIVGSIPPYGIGVERLGACTRGWCQISYRGITGWASMKFLTREVSAGSSYRVRGIRNDDVLFIRAWPSAQSKKVGSIPPNGRGVSKLGPCEGNWCKISYRGITGWASMMYLIADRPPEPAAPAYTPQRPQYAAPDPAPQKPAGKRLSARMTSLLVSSKKFQEMAITNFPRALKSFSRGKGSLQLHGINATIWTEKSFQYGWMAFFNSAVRVIAPRPDRLPVIGYYNPFSDTMLVTVWTQQRGTHRIIDAEMVMGDILRPDKSPPTTKPILMRLMEKGDNWHAAVGFSTARTMLAFESVLANASLGTWRQKLKLSKNEAAVRKLNYAGVLVLANTHLKSIGLYIDPHSSVQSLVESKRIVSATIGLLANGQVKQALARAQTPTLANTKQVLERLPREWIGTLRTSFAVGSPSSFIVYLTPHNATNLNLSLTIKKDRGEFVLDRVDMIDFQSFYAAVKAHEMRRAGGRR